MQSSHSETSSLKAGRRVLGEKTTNASLTPSTRRKLELQKSTIDAIPFTKFSELREDCTTSSEPHHAGQKRTIDNVIEDVENDQPRKVPMMTYQSETGKDFQIFDESARSVSPQRENVPTTDITTKQVSNGLQSPQKEDIPLQALSEESSNGKLAESASSVPTEPAARRIFIQEPRLTSFKKAALVKKRLQSAMHRVGKNPLDRALSQFEASSRRPFLTTITSSSNSSSFRTGTTSQTSPKQKRVLLPPLPIQPRSRPVRSSARGSIPSPTSDPGDNTSQGEREEDEEETPKAQAETRQRPYVDVDEIKDVQGGEENALDKFVKLTQSSTQLD
ncbi:hypothetical protein BGW36DRAFT_362251 [Talaromyces proteolyticus]|uniref:Uncharacterized protein n=1 Tax=Talaromyces proteolyticus TaxID=1131652 RepID=A0AAD4PX41_9EURO|nr:uncharacterized protein BGW36DRAFT_362251 [Talaromyces proteolyticus]KAH8692701.1 hypothetical protein BGW36DRAFT_362251 [Talaromyces proteolyticus]